MDLLDKFIDFSTLQQSFYPMGQKALLKTFAQSHGIKTFAGFFVKLTSFLAFTTHFSSNWQKNHHCAAKMQISVNLTTNSKSCKAFYPMGWFHGKDWICIGNVFPIIYLVNHIEIIFLTFFCSIECQTCIEKLISPFRRQSKV